MGDNIMLSPTVELPRNPVDQDASVLGLSGVAKASMYPSLELALGGL